MKKLLTLFLSTLMLSAFYSCGETAESNEVEKTPKVTEVTTEEKNEATTEEETEATTEETDAQIDELNPELFDASKLEYKNFNYDALTIPVPSSMNTESPLEEYGITRLIQKSSIYKKIDSSFIIELEAVDFSNEKFLSILTDQSDMFSGFSTLCKSYFDYKTKINELNNYKYEPYLDDGILLNIDSLYGKSFVYSANEGIERQEICGLLQMLYDVQHGKLFFIEISDFDTNAELTAAIVDYMNETTKYNPNDTGDQTNNTETNVSTTEHPTEPATTQADGRKAVENGDYSLVTPEFKATMDAYEAFYDEYIAFMNKYNSGEGDITSMMDDYMNMLDKMTEWTNKINAIDEKSLSPADDAYYLLVTMRVEKKLLGAL